MRHPPLLFVDTETLGLDPVAPVWEVAALRVVDGGAVERYERFVKHVPENWPDSLPLEFRDDYESRYRANEADYPKGVVLHLAKMAVGAFVCGSNPSFDMQRLERLAHLHGVDGAFRWHYHPIDVPTMVHGWLCGKGVRPTPPWKSDLLSQMAGVDPKDFNRHTAMGDVLWCKAMWDAVIR